MSESLLTSILCIYACSEGTGDLPQPSLMDNVIITKMSCAGSFILFFEAFKLLNLAKSLYRLVTFRMADEYVRLGWWGGGGL